MMSIRWMGRGKALAGAMVLASCALAGCGGGGSSPGGSGPPVVVDVDTRAPAITGLVADPSWVQFTGGEVRISANVTDDKSPVGAVWAMVRRRDTGISVRVNLANTAGSTYAAEWTAAANLNVDSPRDIEYSIVIYAKDAAEVPNQGQSESSLTVTVGSLDAPPPKPF